MQKVLLNWITKERPNWQRNAITIVICVFLLGINFLLCRKMGRNVFFPSLAMIVISSTFTGYGSGLVVTFITTLFHAFFLLKLSDDICFQLKKDLINLGFFLLLGS